MKETSILTEFLRGEDPVLGRRDFVKLSLGAALACTFAATLGPGRAEAALRVGEVLPTITLTDLKGYRMTLPDDVKGKVILIHFWTSKCSCYKEEIPLIESVYRTYKSKEIAPFAVNVGKRNGDAEAYVATAKLSYPILIDSDSMMAKRYSINSTPITFLCDRKGIIRFKILGEVNRDGLRRMLDALIQ
jgi:cytochrome c biogenesis protein CcmG, thiol:disulfide interchange protein DsbE